MTDGNGIWLILLRRYLIWTAGVNLVWEVLHLPLYTLSQTGTTANIAWILIRCTIGDVLIALSSLVIVLIVFNQRTWPNQAYWRVAGAALVVGLGYTLFSEWYNARIVGLWAYSELMPVLPAVNLGLSPLVQWVVVPLTGFWWAGRILHGHAVAGGGRIADCTTAMADGLDRRGSCYADLPAELPLRCRGGDPADNGHRASMKSLD